MLFAFDINFVLTDCNAWGIKRILYYKINREALTVLCSVVKHLGSSLSTQELVCTAGFEGLICERGKHNSNVDSLRLSV